MTSGPDYREPGFEPSPTTVRAPMQTAVASSYVDPAWPPPTLPRKAVSRRPWFPQPRRGTTPKPRVVAVDAVRGLAVIGMIFAHAGVVGVWGEDLSALVGIAHGHSSILFAVVAGLSLGMITGGTRPPEGTRLLDARLRLGGRAVALLVLGGVLTMLPHYIAVILGSYAVWFIWMIPCLRWRPKKLITAGVLHAVLGLIVADGILFVLSLIEAYPYGSADSFVPEMILSGTYPALIWMGFVFIGAAIARSGISNTAALKRFAVAGLVAFVVGAAPFVIQERSLSPIFAADGYSDDWYFDDEALVDWCLDVEHERLYSCSVPEYEQQEVTFTDEQYDLYWELYDSYYESDDTLCLDTLRERLYPCTQDEYFDALDTLTPEQQELLLTMMAEMVGEGISMYTFSSLFTLQPHSGSPFETVSSGGLAVFLVAGALLLGRFKAARVLMVPFGGIGAMALTAYVAHVVVIAYLPPDQDSNLYPTVLAAALMAGCWLWRILFVAGPLENAVGAFTDRCATLRTKD